MAMNENSAYPQQRYAAAERQHWCCWICRQTMIDRRLCLAASDLPCGPNEHLDVKKAMPRFQLTSERHIRYRPDVDCDRLHYGDPHAATYVDGSGQVRAAHLSCSIAVRSLVRAHGRDEESAIARLHDRAGHRATHGLRVDPVDNTGKRNQNAQLDALEKRHSPVAPLQQTHSVELQSLRTQVPTEVARARLDAGRCPACDATHPGHPRPWSHPYQLLCCGYVLGPLDAHRLLGYR